MNISEIIEAIDRLTKIITSSKLPTIRLLKISDELRLDWGFDHSATFSDDYNEGATQSILVKNLSNLDHPLNAKKLGSSNNKVILSLVDSFMTDNQLTKDRLNDIHSLIIKNGGQYRVGDVNVYTKTSINPKFNFSEPSNIAADIENLVRWYNTSKDRREYHPVFLAAEFHYRFVIVHPYVDGNGRLARIIGSMILLRNRIPPPIFFVDERSLYISRLRKADIGDLESWFQLVGEKIIRSQNLLIKEII